VTRRVSAKLTAAAPLPPPTGVFPATPGSGPPVSVTECDHAAVMELLNSGGGISYDQLIKLM